MRSARISVAALMLAVGAHAIAYVINWFTADYPTSGNFAGTEEVLGWAVLMIPASILGTILAHKRPDHRLGPVFTAGGLVGASAAATEAYAAWTLQVDPGIAPGGTIAILISHVGLFVAWGLLAIEVPLRFPDGELPSRRWRMVEWLGVASVFACVAEVVHPRAFQIKELFFVARPGVDNPIGIPDTGEIVVALFGVGIFGIFGATFLALGSLVVRLVRGRGTERQQIEWVVFATVVFVVVALVYANAMNAWPGSLAVQALGALQMVTTAALIGSFGVAILRHRLWNIEVVVHKTVLYGLMAALVAAGYVIIVTVTGAVLGTGEGGVSPASVVATAAVAMAFHPLRDRVDRVVRRLVYGHRATPYEVVSGMARRLSEALSVEDVLPRLAEAAARGVGATGAAVHLFLPDGGRRTATWPPHSHPVEPTRTMRITSRGEIIGELSVSKPPNDPLTAAEDRLLDDLAQQAGIALDNVRLTAQLESKLTEITASRRRIVEAEDAARRRVERDLHDGAQQRLLSLVLTLGLATERAQSEDVRELIDEARAELLEAHRELRELAAGLHPAILTEAGLRTAIEALAERAPLPVEHRVDCGRYPAAVEAAAYFLVSESLVNVAKYAQASKATVHLTGRDDGLTIEVWDDGVGGADMQSGSGLRGLADRIAAVDGRFEVHSPRGHGTRISAEIPCE